MIYFDVIPRCLGVLTVIMFSGVSYKQIFTSEFRLASNDFYEACINHCGRTANI